jgi:hypothetical protein
MYIVELIGTCLYFGYFGVAIDNSMFAWLQFVDDLTYSVLVRLCCVRCTVRRHEAMKQKWRDVISRLLIFLNICILQLMRERTVFVLKNYSIIIVYLLTYWKMCDW